MCFRPATFETENICPNCGTKNVPNATVCVSCGAEAAESSGYFVPGASPKIPGAPSAPKTPGAPSAPKMPGVTNSRNTPKAPGVPKPPGF